MICVLLILQDTGSPRRVQSDTLSPWIDMVTHPAGCSGRASRRPVAPTLHQDPHAARRDTETIRRSPTSASGGTREHGAVDVPPSQQHRLGGFIGLRERTVAIDGSRLRHAATATAPGGERDRFWAWVDDETPLSRSGRRCGGRCAPADVPGRRRRSRRRVFALRRPEGRPRGADAVARRPPRHRRRRAPLARPGRGGDVRVDARQGRSGRSPARPGQWLDPPRSSTAAPAASGATCSTTPASRGTSRACGRSRPATSSSGCIASRSTEIPVRRYTRTTQS